MTESEPAELQVSGTAGESTDVCDGVEPIPDGGQPSAMGMELEFGDGDGPFPIETSGVVMLSDGQFKHSVSLLIKRGDSSVRLVLTPEDARALQDDLGGAIDEAREKLEERLNKKRDA